MHSNFGSHSFCVLFWLLHVWRYQPEQSTGAYEMANTQDETEMAESYNEGKSDMLPQPEDHFTIKNLLFPSNTEPSPLSGFAVSICASILGETLGHTHIAKSQLYK